MSQPDGLSEGMYFNLSNEDYHNDPALSHSGMKNVLVSWPDYWLNSSLNPDRKKQKQTDAMAFGDRSGMLLLQPNLFHKTYNTHGRSNGTAKGVWLSSVEWERLNESVEAVMSSELGKMHFSDGYPEVSIIWRDRATGIKLRVRVDWLRTFGCIDFKRIQAVDSYTMGRAVKAQGLDIQNFLYLEGVKAARLWLASLGTTGIVEFAKQEKVDPAWLMAFRDDTDLLFRFLFQRSSPPYVWEFRELENDVVVEGANAVFVAVKRYKACLEKYGINRPPLGKDTVKTISPWHIPRRDYDFEEA